MSDRKDLIASLANELGDFVKIAEDALKEIEADLIGNKEKFSIFSEKMFTIRGAAQQLELPEIKEIAGLAEEIGIKAQLADKKPQIRKCVGALWDALTTVKYLLINHESETSEEQDILKNRLNKTLEALGGARETFSPDDIMKMLEDRDSDD